MVAEAKDRQIVLERRHRRNLILLREDRDVRLRQEQVESQEPHNKSPEHFYSRWPSNDLLRPLAALVIFIEAKGHLPSDSFF